MDVSKRSIIITGVVVISVLVWWFYPRKPLPLGYTGTAPNPNNIPGVRPTVECLVDTEFLKKVELQVDGKPVSTTVVTLPRNKQVKLRGKLRLGDLPASTELLYVDLLAVSKSKNAQGMMGEGETTIYTGVPPSGKDHVEIPIDKEWLVPDHAGEFNLILEFHIAVMEERQGLRCNAIVCPVKIE